MVKIAAADITAIEMAWDKMTCNRKLSREFFKVEFEKIFSLGAINWVVLAFKENVSCRRKKLCEKKTKTRRNKEVAATGVAHGLPVKIPFRKSQHSERWARRCRFWLLYMVNAGFGKPNSSENGWSSSWRKNFRSHFSLRELRNQKTATMVICKFFI